MAIRIGDRVTKSVSLSLSEIAEFARLSGDPNPLHHDPEVAARSRFGGIIVSGPQIISLMLGLIPTHLGRLGLTALGLEFTFRFLQAVHADEIVTLEWVITDTESRESLGGDLVTLEGRVTNAADDLFFTAAAKVLAVAP